MAAPEWSVLVRSEAGWDAVARSVAKQGWVEAQMVPAMGGLAEGLKLASGQWVAALNAGDLWPAGIMRRLKKRMEATGAVALPGRTRYFGSPGERTDCLLAAALFRREALDDVARGTVGWGRDEDWYARLVRAGARLEFQPELTLLRRGVPAEGTEQPGGGVQRRAPQARRAWEISVVIPAYNAARYIGEALQSVAAQSLAASEVIVVDDGSTDGTPEIAERCGGVVRVLRQERGGAAAARNLGVRAARGEWVAFLDADDYWLPDRLAWQAEAVEAESSLEVVYGCVQQFYSPDLDWPDTTAHEDAAAVQAGIFPGTCLVRRESFERVGGFETGLRVGEFIDWHARALSAGLRMKTLDVVMMRRRIHDSNTGVREKQAQSDYVRVLKAALDRRRAGRPA
jgi:GT2 family glycosyltransferase